MRKPKLVDLLQQDATMALIADPSFPEPWTQPSQAHLLSIADEWPVDVLTLPYAGCAMLSWTRTVDRVCLVRPAPATDYVRADVTQCRPAISGVGMDLAWWIPITGATDAVQCFAYVDNMGLLYTTWPFHEAAIAQSQGTLSSALVVAPPSGSDRQINVSESLLPQTESFETQTHNAITFWTGAQPADLTTL